MLLRQPFQDFLAIFLAIVERLAEIISCHNNSQNFSLQRYA
jgi:hypothetical protein